MRGVWKNKGLADFPRTFALPQLLAPAADRPVPYWRPEARKWLERTFPARLVRPIRCLRAIDPLVRKMSIKITLTDDEALALLHDLSMVLEDPVEPSLAKLWNKLLPADARRGGLLLPLPES